MQETCIDSWWRHEMETFSALLAICAENSPVPGEFPAQRPVTRSFDVLICIWINGWVNSRDAGDLRDHRAHYDVIVMSSVHSAITSNATRVTHPLLIKMAAILADNIFKYIFVKEKFCFFIKISLKFVNKCPIDNNPTLTRRIGDKPLFEPIDWRIYAELGRDELNKCVSPNLKTHYIDVIMTTMASQITSLTVVYSTVYSDADQRKHQSSASLAFVWGIHRDRWIPRTKGQLRGKCFHLMTSSWTKSFSTKEATDTAFLGNSYDVCALTLLLLYNVFSDWLSPCSAADRPV